MSDDFSPGDPMRAAQKNMRPAVLKRFYASAEAAETPQGFALLLDGRGARTPGKNKLTFPTLAAAELAAKEWAGQGETIDPLSMPVTRIANSALDGVASAMAETRAELAAYAETDLLFYRADAPDKLVALQGAAYDPVLDWVREAYGAQFMLAQGVIHLRQPERSLHAISSALETFNEPLGLAALHVMTTLTGSVLLALGVYRQAFNATQAWRIAHIDEDFQISQWGEDDEAMARRAARWREMEAAAAIAHALTGGQFRA